VRRLLGKSGMGRGGGVKEGKQGTKHVCPTHRSPCLCDKTTKQAHKPAKHNKGKAPPHIDQCLATQLYVHWAYFLSEPLSFLVPPPIITDIIQISTHPLSSFPNHLPSLPALPPSPPTQSQALFTR